MPPPPELTTTLEANRRSMPLAQRIPRWIHVVIALLILAGAITLWRGLRLDPGPSGSNGMMLLSPAAGKAPDALTTFVWRPVPGATTYVLEVVDQGNKVLVSGETADTTLLMAQAALPAVARDLRWRVTARRGDGTEISSNERTIGSLR